MIKLDYGNVVAEAVGPEHGIDLPNAWKAHQSRISAIVANLYATKDEPGGWKKWLNLGYDKNLADGLNRYAASVKGQYQDMVVLGIGGSSLGGKALLKALLDPNWNMLPDAERGGYPRFHFVENVDADYVASLLRILRPEKTLFLVITKSGTTPETMSALMIAREWLEKHLNPEQVKNHIVAITDAKKGILRGIADEEGYPTFEVPDDVGGRFSVFSAVGLLPAALCGVSLEAMQQGIRDLDKELQNPDIKANIAAQCALIHYLMYEKGKTEAVFMPYSFRLSSVSDWFVQLWDESLGKKFDTEGRVVHKGPTAVRAEGVTDQHSQLQLFNEGPNNKLLTFIAVENPDEDVAIPGNQFNDIEALSYLSGKSLGRLMSAELEGTRTSLTRNQRPNLTLTLPKVDAYHFAQLLYLLEVQTAIMGDLLGINTFDQPGVEEGKIITKELMSREGASKSTVRV